MNRNTNHFAITPNVGLPRSRFKTPANIRTTFNTGELIPLWKDLDIYPGETRNIQMSVVCRQSTPIHPTMDVAYLDTFLFYDRYRNTWDHFNEFMGQNTTGAWASSIEYTIPQIKFVGASSASNQYHVKVGDIAHYMGLPIFESTDSTKEIQVSALPFRSYIRIWNNFFRNQNLEAPAFEYTGDNTVTTVSNNDRATASWHDININTLQTLQCKPAPVNKFADFFTTCNPSPQKATAPVTSPIGTSAPVIGTGKTMTFIGTFNAGSGNPVDEGTLYNSTSGNTGLGLSNGSTTGNVGDSWGTIGVTARSGNSLAGLTTDPTKSGMIADLSNAVAATINAQRLAFATQRIYERDTFGTRIFEVIRNHFKTDVDEKVIGIPEYLGGFREPLNITEIPQTSSTDSTTPQGNLAGYGHTVAVHNLGTHSTTEWGCYILLCCVRTMHSYSQGIEKQWLRKRRLEFYWPELCHIGEMPVTNEQIFADGSAYDKQVFGYQEAWAELKYQRNLNTGYFDPAVSGNLASWHYGDLYATLPVLSGDWSNETKDYVDRTLAVTSAVSPQWLLDCHLEIKKDSPIALYCLPGLIDHY